MKIRTLFQALLVALDATNLEREDSADPVIDAQHDETGRMWRGPRSQIPRRYFECDASGVQK